MTRPIPYDRDVAFRVIAEVTRGRRLADVARDPGVPSLYTLQKWRRADRVFDVRLKIASAEARADRMRAKSPYGAHTRAEIVERVRAGQTYDQMVLLPHLPDRSTIFYWMRSEPDFAWAVAGAREEWMDSLTDRIAPLLEGLTPENARGRLAARGGLLNLSRAPKVYGIDLILRDRPQDAWPYRKYVRKARKRQWESDRRWTAKVQAASDALLRKLVEEHGPEAVYVVRDKPRRG